MGFTGRRNPPLSYYGSLGRTASASDRSRPHHQQSLSDPGHEASSRDAVVVVRSHERVAAGGGWSSCSSRPRGGGGGGHAKKWRVVSLQLLSALALGGVLVAAISFGVSSGSPSTASPREEQARLDNTADTAVYPNIGEDLDETSRSAIGSGGGRDDWSNNDAIGGLAPLRPGEDAAHPTMLSFTAANFYHLRDGKPARDYPWLEDVKLIEPHRETTLTVADAREGFDYQWAFRGGTGGGQATEEEAYATAVGAECTVVLTRLDENVVSLEEVNEDGEVTRRLEERVMVKYVRREIRTLTDEEREELLDAVRSGYCSDLRVSMGFV